MKLNQTNRSARRRSQARRGTVIMLVVAVITLLAVLGTVYVLGSRTERISARTTGEAVNYERAVDAVNELVRDAILRPTLLPARTAGSVPNMDALKTAGVLPDGAVLGRPPFWSAGVQYVQNDVVIGADGRLYKAGFIHTSSLTTVTNGPPGASGSTQWTLYTGQPISSRWFDYPEQPPAASWASGYGTSASSPGLPDEPWLATDIVLATAADVSTLTSKRYNPGTGAYDIDYVSGSLAADTGAKAVGPDASGPDDAVRGLLPFSTNNVRFRYYVRVVDTGRMLNLNTGNWDGQGPNVQYDTNGSLLTSPLLSHTSVFVSTGSPADQAKDLQGGGKQAGRVPGAAPASTFDPIAHQNLALGYERFGVNPAASLSAPTAQWFDIVDELELRAYGIAGTTYGTRVAGTAAMPLWYNTLKPGSANRKFYTTTNFDRNLAPALGVRYKISQPVALPAGALTANSAAVPAGGWTLPKDGAGNQRMVNLSASTGGVNEVARNAVYLANLMFAAGYSDDECLQAAVNYAGQVLNTSYSPAYIDGGNAGSPPGMLVVAKPPASPGPPLELYAYQIDVVFGGALPAKRYFAYQAQPYLNEVSCVRPSDPGTTPAPKWQGFGVELINPHRGPVPMNAVTTVTGWKVRINGSDWANDVGATLFATTSNAMPARSFAVITSTEASAKASASGPGNGLTVATGVPTADVDYAANGGDPTAGASAGQPAVVTLERPYYDYKGTIQYMVVDRIQYSFPAFVVGASDKTIYSKQRNNKTVGTYGSGTTPATALKTVWPGPPAAFTTPTMIPTTPAIPANDDNNDWWLAASEVNYSDETQNTNPPASGPATTPSATKAVAPSLGTWNNVPGDPKLFGIDLTDRFCETTAAAAGNALIRDNVGDLMGYMRIGIQYTTPVANSTPDGFYTIPNILAETQTPTAGTPLFQRPLTIESSDQWRQEARARFHFLVDPRALALLTNVAPVDRASDGSDQLGNGADGIDEVRIPGRVNVNTAPAEVLRAVLENFYAQAAGGPVDATKSQAAVTAIINYRDRKAPFNNIPGKGIKSLVELSIPLGTTVDGNPAGNASSSSAILALQNTYPYFTTNSNYAISSNPAAFAITLDMLYNPKAMAKCQLTGAADPSTGAPLLNVASWAKLFTVGTVRSDVFVVYGYLEVVQAHPKFTGTHNNGSDWYDVTATGTTDDPTATGVKNLRLSTRRWVAVMDRSWCNTPRFNTGFALPRTLGLRELPP